MEPLTAGRRVLLALLPAICAACAADGGSSEGELLVTVDTEKKLAEVDARYLSFTLDTDKVVAQKLDLTQPRLLKLASALKPAILRIGGTRADTVYYDLAPTPVRKAPDPYKLVMGREIWDGACKFAKDLGVEIMFNVNAGKGPRVDGKWTPDNAEKLVTYTQQTGCPVSSWELGNEPGGFGLMHGLFVSGKQLAADYAVLDKMLQAEDPTAKIAGPSPAFWPKLGEVATKVTPEFLAAGAGKVVDLLTWHYYPQQSSSCPLHSRRTTLETLLDPDNLDEIERWAQQMEDLRDRYAKGARLVLDETSHAQCGGEPGISDRFVTGFWWMDQLALIARRGQPLMMRQALVGGHYTLLREKGLEPTPDFFNSVLWNRLMGATVLDPAIADKPDKLRLYAHCTAKRKGAVTVLAINLDEQQSFSLRFSEQLGDAREVYLLSGEKLDAETIRLNGKTLSVAADGTVPTFAPQKTRGSVALSPLTYALIVLPQADARACL